MVKFLSAYQMTWLAGNDRIGWVGELIDFVFSLFIGQAL